MDDSGDNSQSLRSQKKSELRQRQAIMTQFDKLATTYSGGKSSVGRDATIVNKVGKEIVETAGMIKKKARDKKKKEKSLGAKLRLRTKKGGGDK